MHWLIIAESGEVFRVKNLRQVDQQFDLAEAVGCDIVALCDYNRPRISNKEAASLMRLFFDWQCRQEFKKLGKPTNFRAIPLSELRQLAKSI